MNVLNKSFTSIIFIVNFGFGQPSFTEHEVSTSADGANTVYAADMDGDGDMDILSASILDDKIAWYENDGSQNFTDHEISTSADHAESVYAADMDGDGDMDALSASQSDDKIAWYENDGSQNFTEYVISSYAEEALDVYAADVDGDGDMDVLSASNEDNTIAWYENDGNQIFTKNIISTSALGVNTVYAADMDGDGDMDALSASFSDNKIAWYENDGSQNFTEHEISTSADGALYVYPADVDGDGDMDVLSASFFDDKIAWYENQGQCADEINLWGNIFPIETETINLMNSGITGSIPEEIGCFSNLTRLWLQDNEISGIVPESICNLDLEWNYPSSFLIFNNMICPPYPDCIADYMGSQDISSCEVVSVIDDVLPNNYSLYNAYPNPFNPITRLSYDLPKEDHVVINIYDIMGREVIKLVNTIHPAGFHSVHWDGTNHKGELVSTGMYIIKMEAGDFLQTGKMLFIK